MRRALGLVLLAVVFGASGLAAQVCLGRPALGTNSMANIGGGVSFFDGGNAYGARAAFGGQIFGLAGFDYYDFDETTISLKAVSGGFGYEVSGGGGAISICPGVVVTYGFGLEILGIDFTVLEVAPGLAVGLLSELSPTISVAPFAQAAFVYARASADAGPLGEASEDDTAGLLSLGLSLIFNDRFSVGPSVTIPFARDENATGDDTLVSVFFALALSR